MLSKHAIDGIILLASFLGLIFVVFFSVYKFGFRDKKVKKK
jgi:hypothetical protein